MSTFRNIYEEFERLKKESDRKAGISRMLFINYFEQHKNSIQQESNGSFGHIEIRQLRDQGHLSDIEFEWFFANGSGDTDDNGAPRKQLKGSFSWTRSDPNRVRIQSQHTGTEFIAVDELERRGLHYRMSDIMNRSLRAVLSEDYP